MTMYYTPGKGFSKYEPLSKTQKLLAILAIPITILTAKLVMIAYF